MASKTDARTGQQGAGLVNDMSGLYARTAQKMLEIHLKNLESVRNFWDGWFDKRLSATEALCRKLDAANSEADFQKRTEAYQKMSREWLEGVSQELNEQIETMSRSAGELMENGGIQIPMKGAVPPKSEASEARSRPNAA